MDDSPFGETWTQTICGIQTAIGPPDGYTLLAEIPLTDDVQLVKIAEGVVYTAKARKPGGPIAVRIYSRPAPPLTEGPLPQSYSIHRSPYVRTASFR